MNAAVFDAALESLPARFREASPSVAAVLGSGWNGAASALEAVASVSYADIAGMGGATVLGHDGKLLLCKIPGGGEALLFCGRRHWYEGAEWEAVTMPAVLAARLGCRAFLATNAAGGISRSLPPGRVVVLRDHNRQCALSPLRGPHEPSLGPRFPDQSRVYDPELAELLREAGRACGIALSDGVYAFSGGPAFETPAEVRAYGILGADVVGMSTVPETMVASSMGMRVAGLSFVSNAAAGISAAPLDGTDVVECAARHSKALSALVVAALQSFAAAVSPGA